MKIIVTGGAGFIGSNFIYYMLETHPEYEIVCLDALTYAGNLSTLEKAMKDVKDDGYVIMLLRLNFFGSKDRFPFFKQYMPEWCFVHHIRIGFLDKKDEEGYVVFDKSSGLPKRGTTDSIEYCHMVFRKGYHPDHTKLVII